MISRQDDCIIHFPDGSGSEAEFSPVDIDQFTIKEEIGSGDEVDCPQPNNMGGRTMATTSLRLINLKNTHSDFDKTDIKILITPASIAINTVGGVTAPNPSYNNEPLTIRIRSEPIQPKQGTGTLCRNATNDSPKSAVVPGQAAHLQMVNVAAASGSTPFR